MNENVATTYVRLIQVPSVKRRPVYILQEDDERIHFWDITTKFKK